MIPVSLFFFSFSDTERTKTGPKDETSAIIREEDRGSCSNPLPGFSNAINSIPDGVDTEETAATAPIPPTVKNKQAPPKAMVKPQVLTDVFERFVIHEGKLFFENLSS